MRPAVRIAVTAFATAIAAWLLPASVHVISWDEGGPARVAVFASAWWLVWSAALAAAAAAALWLLPPRTSSSRAVRASTVAPLGALSLCVLPYLPWLPDRIPVLLVLAGPIKWVVLAVALAVMCARATNLTARLSHWAASPSRRLLFGLSFAIYLGFGLLSLTTIGLKGDEPHYLIISQSLLADGDLKIENNHRRREYLAFTREELPPDYLQRGTNGEIYSIHAPGLPALLVPIYAAAGAVGSLVLICVAGALAALGVFELAALTAGPVAGLLTWVAVSFSVPFMPYAWSIFPEMPGAAAVAWCAVWLASTRNYSRGVWFARGLALALLPWLHTKFVILEAALGCLLAWRLRRDKSAVGALLTPILISAILWFGFFYIVYGTPNPEAPYGNFARDWVRLGFVPRGILGLLWDQKFGLITYAPVYALVPVGLWVSMRRRQPFWTTVALATVAAVYAISSARLYMWWGGWSAPARFLVPALPLVAPALALAFATIRNSRFSWPGVLLLAISVITPAVSAVVPGRLLLYSDAHGVSRLAEMLQGSAPLTATLPMFTESQWQWRDLIPRSYRPEERLASVVRGRVDLLELHGTGGQAFDYATWRRLGSDAWRAAGTLTRNLMPSGSTPPMQARGIYAEGASFWTMSTERGLVLLAPGGHGAIELTVHIGPTGGHCRTTVNGETRDEPMQPNETRGLLFDDIPADAAWLPISVQASHAFRPADVDQQSGDTRLLGCQVHVGLR